jgi:hypothetical protein
MSILNQTVPVRTREQYPYEIQFNIILPSKLRVSHQITEHNSLLSHSWYMHRQSQVL